LKNFQASLNNSQAVSLIGKRVTADGNNLELSDNGPAQCNFKLDDDAAIVAISIYDHTGNYVAEIKGENLQAGQHALTWDGTDLKGNRVAAGEYSFEVLAEDAKGQSVRTTTLFSGLVDRVVFENNTSYLISGNQKIALGDVIEVAASGEARAEAQDAPIAAETESTITLPPNPMINGGK
jgi:flagellar basal-body rod modification protein FlgD